MKRAGKTIECFNDIRKYLFEHKVPALTFIREGKIEILYTQMYVDEKDKEIERLNNIINELEKYISQEWYCFDNESAEFEVSKNILHKLKELKESGNK